ncbi:hypothetical protein [Chryseobacterium culicis]|uniref:Uncharacterized protein n=1 Tax=Chryseobacterium culicis TaxID=680127 RepID=A0A1H6ISN3_CHRCI|nr:hypothetical protein [Chryseobacterium culicis]SEH49298.1 hypothetical protein SAMN05421593_0117 [Chryseobacterium culicis]
MEKIKKAYYYFFYKLYKHSKGSIFPENFTGSIFLGTLGIWFTITLLNYYNIFIDKSINFTKEVYIGIAVFFLLTSYITIDYNDTWKKYNQEFDQLPTEKNKVGGIIVWSVIIVIVANMIFSYYFLYERAKRNQTGPYAKEYIQQQKIKDSLENIKYKKRMEDIRQGK